MGGSRAEHEAKAAEWDALDSPEAATPDQQDNAMPPFPGELAYILAWFLGMSRERQMGPAAPQKLTAQHRMAWASELGVMIKPDEALLLQRLDDAWMAAYLANADEERRLRELQRAR